VILLTAPHQHDLITNSCVNKEVEAFNRKLHKKVERLKKFEIIDVVNERKCYTRHGQHLNSAGKDSMSKRITTAIEHLFNRDTDPIKGNGIRMKIHRMQQTMTQKKLKVSVVNVIVQQVRQTF